MLSSGNTTNRQGVGIGGGLANSMNSAGVLRQGGVAAGSLDDTLVISHHGINMDSFDDLQSSIDTKRMKTQSSAFIGGPEDLIEVRHFNMREFKEPQPKEAREKQLLEEELKDIRDEMKFKGTSRMQEAMG